MRTALQVLFGLMLAVLGLIICLYLGLLVRRGAPDWRSAAMTILLLVAAQGAAFFAFRRHVALQVLLGLVFCMATTAWLICSRFSFSWEPQYPDGSNPITWRSGVLFLFLLTSSEWLAFVVFRRIRGVWQERDAASARGARRR